MENTVPQVQTNAFSEEILILLWQMSFNMQDTNLPKEPTANNSCAHTV